MKFRVDHNDRQIEFIDKKTDLDNYINRFFAYDDLGSSSCEDIAEDLLKRFKADYVSVFEDNENGAEIYADTYHRPN
jgi:hypothetical protein